MRSRIVDDTAKPNRRFFAVERRSRFVELHKLAEGFHMKFGGLRRTFEVHHMRFEGLRRTFEAHRKICVEPVFYLV